MAQELEQPGDLEQARVLLQVAPRQQLSLLLQCPERPPLQQQQPH